jgi:hypothetical protein
MATTSPTTSETKRAKPRLDVYAGLLTVAFLLCVFGAAVVALMNMDATGQGPFDTISSR